MGIRSGRSQQVHVRQAHHDIGRGLGADSHHQVGLGGGHRPAIPALQRAGDRRHVFGLAGLQQGVQRRLCPGLHDAREYAEFSGISVRPHRRQCVLDERATRTSGARRRDRRGAHLAWHAVGASGQHQGSGGRLRDEPDRVVFSRRDHRVVRSPSLSAILVCAPGRRNLFEHHREPLRVHGDSAGRRAAWRSLDVPHRPLPRARRAAGRAEARHSRLCEERSGDLHRDLRPGAREPPATRLQSVGAALMGFMSGGTNGAATPNYTGLNIQTSAQGVPIALVWGVKRIGTNLIWQGDFTAVRSKKGTGKGGEGKNPINKYTVAVAMALGEGPILGIGTVWQDKTVTTLANLGLTLFLGSAAQAAWSYLVSNHPSQALSYARTAYVANSAYDLGRQPTLPNHNYEVCAGINGAGGVGGLTGWVDVPMADVIKDFSTNPQYSIGLPATAIDNTSWTTYRNYCNAQGLVFSPDLVSLEQVSAVLDRWAQLTNSWIFWSGNALKFVPLGDSPIDTGAGPFTQVDVATVPLSPTPVVGGYKFYARVGLAFYGVTNVGVSYQGGSALTSVGGAPAQGQYNFDGTATYTFNAADAGQPIVVTYTRPLSAGGNSFTPNVTAAYNLTYDDFVSDKGTPPVTVTRVDPADAPNHVKLEVKDRDNAYNTAGCEWKDQGLVDQFGVTDAPTTQAHEICWVQVGKLVAQLIGQRLAYIRNTYDFKLGFEYGSILEPGDIVTLTDPHIGITAFPVRIRTLDEDEAGNWAILAEEFPGGIGTITSGRTASTTGPRRGAGYHTPASRPIHPPGVFEPNSALANGHAQLWVAASGGKNWGGCVVYVSLDNVNYTPIGTIS